MSDSSFQDQFTATVLVQRIIILALLMGCLTFTVVAVVVVATNGPTNEKLLITYVALAAIFPTLVAFFVVRNLIAAQGRRTAIAIARRETDKEEELPDLLSSSEVVHTMMQYSQTRMIVGAALLEGNVFFCLVSYFVEGSPLTLVAACLLAIGILTLTPTRSSVARWILDQAKQANSDR